MKNFKDKHIQILRVDGASTDGVVETTNTVENISTNSLTTNSIGLESSEDSSELPGLLEQENGEPHQEFIVEEVDEQILFDERIYELLPEPLKSFCNHHEGKSKDLVLLSTLVTLSSVLPNVYTKYNTAKLYPNLNLFVIAPPASGKGVMEEALKVIDTVINNVEIKNEKLLIPANSSSAAIIEFLTKNENGCLMHETEADSLSVILGKEWGNFSDILRKAFHHEKVSLARKTKNEFLTCKEPKLSLCLSGTPNQLAPLINSVANGLYSRFLFLNYNQLSKWKNQFLTEEQDRRYSEIVQNFDNLTAELNQHLLCNPYIFKLTEEQINDLNKLSEQLDSTMMVESPDMVSVTRRLPIIALRLMMILTLLENAEDLFQKTVTDKVEVSDLYVSENAFQIVSLMVPIILEHSEETATLYRKKSENIVNGYLEKIHKDLPDYFKMSEAYEFDCFKNRSRKTVQNKLKELVNAKMLVQPQHGFYRKISDKTNGFREFI